MKNILIVAMVLIMLSALSAEAVRNTTERDVPQTINFQAAVNDADGMPVNDTRIIEFRIYDVLTGGTELWSEILYNVQITDGIFSEELGGTAVFPDYLFTNMGLYITFVMGGQEMSPRQKLNSVPFAIEAQNAQNASNADFASYADEAMSVGGLTSVDIVSQDFNGDANVMGTMTANAFVGDGSGLTNLTAMDDDYVNAVGPDSMSAYTSLGVLNIQNTFAGGSGVKVTDAGYGIHVENADAHGLLIDSSGNFGIEIGTSGSSGIHVNDAGIDGVSVTTAAVAGFYVNSAGQNGFEVGSATDNGVYIGSAGDDGVHVYNAGTPSTQTESALNNGLEVAGAEGNGLYVGYADQDGVYVHSSGDDGIYVGTVDDIGFVVDSAQNYGVKVHSAGTDGIYVYNAGTPSTQHSSALGNGFEVAGTEGSGLWVGQADNDGIYVYSANDCGVQVYDAYNGFECISASSAAFIGNTDDAAGEWGVYTPDKIYGSNVTSRSQSTYVRNTGSESLEAGDIVCISGGFAEDVLGENEITANIEKANSRNSHAVFGVVEYKVSIKEEADERNEGRALKSFEHADGRISNGDYLSVIVFGIADVKTDGRSNIEAGQKLTISDNNGKTRSINQDDNWTVGILGKSLEDSNGKDTVKVFVNCK